MAIVAVSTAVTAWQAFLTRDELDALTTQQRPWVKVDVELISGMLVWEAGAAIGYRVNATNVGSLPARRAWVVQNRVYAYPVNAGDRPEFELPEVCPDLQPYALGGTIFPDETVDMNALPVYPSRAEVDTWEHNGQIAFQIAVCVQYEDTRGRLHQTGTIYMVRRTLVGEDGHLVPFESGRQLLKPEQTKIMRLSAADVAT